MKLVNKIMLVWVVVFFILLLSIIMTGDELATKGLLLMLMVLGGVMCIDLLKDLNYCLQSKSWPTTPSIIQNSKISRSLAGENSSRIYTPHFTVEYIVNERQYQYEFKNPNPEVFSSEEQAQEYVNDVESGKVFEKIYYNPAKPELSNIEPGLRIQHILGIALGGALIVIPALALAGIIVW